MFRLWGKVFENNHLLKDITIENPTPLLNRTRKVLSGLEAVCNDFDLPVPIWLDTNIEDFKSHSKTRFTQDNFIEFIPFDYLEIHVIEED